MKYEITSIDRKHIDSINKDVANCRIQDEQGNEYEKQVSIWSDFPAFETLNVNSIVEGTITVNPKGYASLYAPKGESGKKPNMDRIIEKKQQGIAESQARKEQSIAKAQDRSAWMWAKVNASNLLAHQKQDSLAIRDLNEIAEMVVELATKIYNAEPTEPFS